MRSRLPLLAATAGALLCAGAHAQSGTQVYGLLDAGVEYVTHAKADGGGMTRVITSGKNTSRWGLRGSEKLSPALELVWNLEGGVKLDTGADDGGLFRRQAYVGLDGRYGRLVLGRSFTTLYDFVVPFDPMSYAGNYSWLVNTSASAPAKYGMTSAFDNLVKYAGALGPFKFGATLGLGEKSSAAADSRRHALAGTWTHEALSLMLAFEQVNGDTIVASGARDQSRATYFGIDYKSGAWRASGGARNYRKQFGRANAPELDARTLWAGLNYAATPAVTLTGAVYAVKVDSGTSLGQASPVLVVARVVRALSRRTDLYLALGHASDDDGRLVGLSRDDAGFGPRQSGLTAGMQHRF